MSVWPLAVRTHQVWQAFIHAKHTMPLDMGWHTMGNLESLRTMLQPLVSTSQELDEERLLLTTRTRCTKICGIISLRSARKMRQHSSRHSQRILKLGTARPEGQKYWNFSGGGIMTVMTGQNALTGTKTRVTLYRSHGF